MPRFRVVVPPEVAEIVRSVHPDLKRSIRNALEALSREPSLGSRLRKELTGLRRYRVKRYRIVYRVISAARQVRVEALGPRRTIYDDLVARTRR